ncbi:MAG: alpha/beta hydrolase [Promethearchaeota archaeon]
MVKIENYIITNYDIELESEFYESTSEKDSAIILCHPDPRMGGNFYNNVISGIFEKSINQDISCLRFNFRGVGRSTGNLSNGSGEHSDVKACIDYLIEKLGVDKIFLCGYSFGAAIGCSTINYSDKIIGFAAISLPFDLYNRKYEDLSQTEKPKLFIQGDRDSFIPLSNFEKHYASYQDPKSFKVIDGADHLYWSYEGLIANEVINFFKSLK